MAEIWKAKVSGPAGFEKVLAIKRILPQHTSDEDFVEMFIEEAKLAAQLHHPNIVQVFDFGMTDARDYFIAMEYVAGPNLAALLKRLRRAVVSVPPDVAVYVAQEVCKGLGHAHDARDNLGKPLGLIHRDISPQNLLLSFGGEVKITDFGIAKVAQASTRTSEGHVRGKLSYMSPEQARLAPLDPRSDLFSVGLVLYQLITGDNLFTGNSAQEIYAAVMQFQGPTGQHLAKVPPRVREVVQIALQLDPENRYQTATQMEMALNGVLGPNGSVQARNTLSNFIQRHFVDEYAQEHGSEETDLGTVTKLSESSAVRPAPVAVDGGPPNQTVVVDSTKARVPPDGTVSGETSLAKAPVRTKRSPLWALVAVLTVGLVAISGLFLKNALFPTGETAEDSPSSTASATAVAGTSAPAATATAAATPTPTTMAIAPTPKRTWPVKTPTPRPTATAKPTATRATTGTARGTLVIKARPWANVWIGGSKMSRAAPLGTYRVKAGTYKVRFQNPALKADFTRSIRVPAGRQVSFSVNMSTREVKATK